MSIQLEKRPALLLIDIQKGFEDIDYWGGGRNHPDAEANAGKLLQVWRAKHLPIFHVKHCSTTPESPLVEGKLGNEFAAVVQPLAAEPVIKKNVNSAFIGTDLKELLEADGITQVVIVGMTTDHCVSTSTRMAGNLGFDTYLVNDAVATFDKVGVNGEKYTAQLIHDTAIASLNEEFATVLTMEDVLKSLQN
ncbi:MAG: cysteine hydrolase family protein [Flammeovirgaceae bacterium]